MAELLPRPLIPLTRPLLEREEEEAVLNVLRSGQLVQGPEVARFEVDLAAHTQRAHAVAVSSGTAALGLALRALGVGAGDEVLCPALTWPSPAHAVLELGAMPRLVDVDPHSWNVTTEGLAAARTARCRAAILIDQFGFPVDVPRIAAALPGLPLIVDAACSLGSTLAGSPCGSFGEIACMSFHPRKIITTGEGGMCLTDDPELAARLRSLRNHGQEPPGHFVCAAGNARMGELAAALGRVQLKRLPTILAHRQRLSNAYLARLPPHLTPQRALAGATSNYQTFGVLLERERCPLDRDQAIAALAQHDVQAGRLSYALHELPQLSHLPRGPGKHPLATATSIAERGLCLPLYTHMTPAEQDRVLAALESLVLKSVPS